MILTSAQAKAEGMPLSRLIGLPVNGLVSGGSESDAVIGTVFLAIPPLIIMFFLILRRHKRPAAPPPPYDFGPSPKVPTSILLEKISSIDNTHLSPHPNPYGPMYGNLASSFLMDESPQGRESSTQSVPPHGNSLSTLNTQSVPLHQAYHPTHGHVISSPSVSVHSSVGDITGTTITNVGTNNSYGHPQASLSYSHPPMYTLETQSASHHNTCHPIHGHPISSPSVSVNSEGYITNTEAQSIPHHNAYHPTQGRPISGPSVSVHSGVGKITDTTITNIGDNNIYEGTASDSHPLMSTLDTHTQSVPYHQPVHGHSTSSSSVSVGSGENITNTTISNVGNNNFGNPQKNNGSNVQAQVS